MSLPAIFDTLRLPVIGAPLFIISNPALVIAQCKAGIVGSFPGAQRAAAGAARRMAPRDHRGAWRRGTATIPTRRPRRSRSTRSSTARTTGSKPTSRPAPSGRCRSPSPRSARATELNDAVHGWGGITLHDIIDDRFARKAIEKGADGLIAVAAGAGGHAGKWSPFALVQEIRRWFDGPLALSGAIATGGAVLAAQAMGADLAYIGSPFIATDEARAEDDYKQGIVDGGGADIVNSNLFTGINGNYLRGSIVAAGLDPDNLPAGRPGSDEFPVGHRGQGVARHLGIGPGHRRDRQGPARPPTWSRGWPRNMPRRSARARLGELLPVRPATRSGSAHRPPRLATDIDMGEMPLRGGRRSRPRRTRRWR